MAMVLFGKGAMGKSFDFSSRGFSHSIVAVGVVLNCLTGFRVLNVTSHFRCFLSSEQKQGTG